MSNPYRNFELQPLADGIWIARSGVNAGIVDLGDQLLVFDTFSIPSAAHELRAAAESLTGRRVTHAINSHAHADHVQGNIAFADHAFLVSSAATRAAMRRDGAGALERMKADMTRQMEGVREQHGATAAESERTRLHAVLQEYEEFLAGYPTPADLRLPTLTYERQLTFHGSRRTAHLITFGGAHSPCDAVLWLPAEKLLFTGDLVIPAGNLITTLGQPENWLPILDQMEALGAERLAPGHGKVVPAAEGYAWVRQYLTNLFRQVEEAVAAGESADFADGVPVPVGCNALWFRRNVRFLMERALGR